MNPVDRMSDAPAARRALAPAGERANGRVLAVYDSSRGNFSHVIAVGNVLADSFGGEVEVLTARPRLRLLAPILSGLAQGPVLAWLRRRPALRKFLWRLCFSGAVPSGPAPVCLVSTLRRGELVSILLARYWGCENYHIGRPKRHAQRDFTAVITPPGLTPAPDEIGLPIAPTSVDRQEAIDAGNRFLQAHNLSRPLWALLIGGDGSGYEFTAEEWRQLAQGLKRLAQEHRIAWLLTTSPRTTLAVEELLRRELSGPELAYGVWFGSRPEKVVAPFLGAAERIFVTEESTSMISDALVMGRPLYAVFPAKRNLKTWAARFVDQQEQECRLQRCSVGALQSLNLEELDGRFAPLTEDWEAVLARQIQARAPRAASVRRAA